MSYLANMTKNADELTTKVRNLKKTLEDLENQLSIQKSYVSIGSSETKASNFVEFQKAIQAPSQFALNVKNALETMKRYNIITYRVEDDMYCFAKARPPIILGSELLYNFFTSYSSNLDYIEDWSYAKEYQFWNFIDSMKRNYDSEENRTTVFRNCWKDLFGQYLTKDQLSTNSSSCSKGKGYQIDLVDINKRILMEVKNEKINITSEPFIETVAYFVHSGQDEEVNERILVCIVGPSISVYGAVYCEISKEIIVERLLHHLPRYFSSITSPIQENHAGCPRPPAKTIIPISKIIKKGRNSVNIFLKYKIPIAAIKNQPSDSAIRVFTKIDFRLCFPTRLEPIN